MCCSHSHRSLRCESAIILSSTSLLCWFMSLISSVELCDLAKVTSEWFFFRCWHWIWIIISITPVRISYQWMCGKAFQGYVVLFIAHVKHTTEDFFKNEWIITSLQNCYDLQVIFYLRSDSLPAPDWSISVNNSVVEKQFKCFKDRYRFELFIK